MARRAYALGAVSLLEKVSRNNRGNGGDLGQLSPQQKAIFTMLRKEVERRYEMERTSGEVAA